jgi:hypothetical protein
MRFLYPSDNNNLEPHGGWCRLLLISNKFEGVQGFMRSLYTSDNTKTLINLKQIWRVSRIYEIFIYIE